MNIAKKVLIGTAIAAVASSASATLYKFEAAYGLSDAQDAATDFNNSTNNQVLEDFEGFGQNPADNVDNGSDQNSWLEAKPFFDTAVGRFSMQTPDSNPDAGDVNNDYLMIEDATTGEFGRNAGFQTQWLDSNDADAVHWDILDGSFNAFGFWLSDANDQGAALKLEFSDGTSETLQLQSGLDNGNIAYITVFSDVFFNSATLLFNNGSGENDGWGIDNVTIARVPEPGTLALLGLGLAGLALARRRKL